MVVMNLVVFMFGPSHLILLVMNIELERNQPMPSGIYEKTQKKLWDNQYSIARKDWK
jgi:hypothetical protein